MKCIKFYDINKYPTVGQTTRPSDSKIKNKSDSKMKNKKQQQKKNNKKQKKTKQKTNCQIVDFAVPEGHSVKIKINTKREISK